MLRDEGIKGASSSLNIHWPMTMKLRLVICTAILGCGVFLSTAQAHALAISPVLFDFEVAPGSSRQAAVTITNDTEQEETFVLRSLNFIPSGECGQQQYLEEPLPSDLASWIFPGRPSVTLAPGERAEFSFAVNVPRNAEPGGHYASLFFSRLAEQTSQTGVGVGSEVGVLILVNVPGNVREDARVESFMLRGGTIRDRLPVYFDLRLRNLGSVHFRPRGTLVVKNMLGRTVARLSANPNNVAALPNSVRRVESVWARTLADEQDQNPCFYPPVSDTSREGGFFQNLRNEWDNFALGRYTAGVEITYGSAATPLQSAEVTFWVIPWRMLTVAGVGAALLFVLLRLYNRVLVSSALKKERKKR